MLLLLGGPRWRVPKVKLDKGVVDEKSPLLSTPAYIKTAGRHPLMSTGEGTRVGEHCHQYLISKDAIIEEFRGEKRTFLLLVLFAFWAIPVSIISDYKQRNSYCEWTSGTLLCTFIVGFFYYVRPWVARRRGTGKDLEESLDGSEMYED